MFSSVPPRRRAVASGVAGLAALVAVFVGASPAHAAVSVTPSTGLSATTTTTVDVSGTVPGFASSATHVTAAVCNVASGVTPGSRCDAVRATGFETVSSFNAGFDLDVLKTFSDYTFLGGGGPVATGTTTTCRGATGSQCAVVVSYYSGSGAGATQLGAETFNITFS